ncbi:hypothetical protein JIN82_07565 [Persicirhabdus sediminis]|uniref:Uncharacterized protein n=2 Tax=Persicirhabdus sediminis TaxID=454144 RepID=A0A8J7MEE8_9BACT|nr:hypothetical protein [Persicirhabdus sediminis]
MSFKKIVLGVLGIVVVGGLILLILIYQFLTGMIDEEVSQHDLGVAYMSSIDEQEMVIIIRESDILMEKCDPNSLPKNMGEFSEEKVPERWANIGVQGIRYTNESVVYYFCGGGMRERTLLRVLKSDDESHLVHASYRDQTESVQLHPKASDGPPIETEVPTMAQPGSWQE